MAFLVLFSATAVHAQYFGKNKVNYTAFDWMFIQTENFDIYYTEGGYEIALIASRIAEDAYRQLSEHWNYSPRNRIPLLVYKSFNDFSQTNVILDVIEEGTGGFTELFKNRVVIPWEGSLAKFKHVIHHELTHAMYFDMLYGGVVESIVGREYLFQLPLWFAEGLAEHESQYWSNEADMIVRDGIITGYLPQIKNIYGGYLVYKGGESFFKFLQEEYGGGTRIAGDILQSLRKTKNLENSFKSITGKDLEELSKEWHRKLKADHWPEVAGREISEDFATRLTDHMEIRNYLNVNPAINPTGDKIAFLTDRNGYKEIMLMSAIDGKILDTVVRGEKAGEYEEMHWLRGGITWSPDGTMIAFAAKAGKSDAIHIHKVEEGGYNTIITPDMDAVYSPDWSPDGSKILFCGIKNNKLDLFTIDLETMEYRRLTNDYFDELNPRWSPDAKKIVFSSDRMDAPYDYAINEMNGNYDLFVMDADGSDIKRVTTNAFNDIDPSWSPDGTKIVFVSDRNGISNLYYLDINEMTVTPLTNLLTGCSSPWWSPDDTKIAFTSFKEGGWDVYILKRPLKRNMDIESIKPTAYRTQTLRNLGTPDSTAFTEIILHNDGSGQELVADDLPERKYRLKFSPDMFNAFASYNTFYGLGGMGQLSLSDIMGNHRVYLGANLMYTLEESDLAFQYWNLKHHTNYGISAFHYKTYYRSYNWNIFSDRIYGGSVITSYPFSKFTRQDLSVNYLRLQRDSYKISQYSYHSYYTPTIFEHTELDAVSTFTLKSDFVRDTTLWGYTGPVNGKRYKFNVEYGPPLSLTDLSFTTVELDYRRYHRIGRRHTFLTRFSGGASFGDEPRMFFLGGTDNWLNARISSIPYYMEDLDDLFFARFPFPLRGYKYYQEYGRRYFLANFEFRFPFIDYLALGWPLPIALGNISGVLFTDIGSAWYRPVGVEEETGKVIYDKTFHGGGLTSGSFELDDIKMSYGFGMRMNLGFAVLRLDSAWQTNINEQEPKPMFSFSLGPEF